MHWTFRLTGVVAVFLATHTAGAQIDGHPATCLAEQYDWASTPDEDRIQELAQWLRQALETHPSLDQALKLSAPEICLVDTIFGAEGYFSVEENRIVFRRSLPDALMRAVAIHELRHVHQARYGVCPDMALSMEQTASATLALEADASAVSLAVAWGLREDGSPDVWDALAAWPTHADLARAFEAEMTESGDISHATARAFAEWYVSDWRRDSYFLSACSDYLDRLDDTHAIPRYGTSAPEFLGNVCKLPDGRQYPCEKPNLDQ